MLVGSTTKTIRAVLEERRNHGFVAARLRNNSRNRNAVFIWIPKTARTSLMTALESHNAVKIIRPESLRAIRRFEGIYSFGHMSIAALLELNLLDHAFFDSAFKFAVVRNPFDRAVSLFHYLKRINLLPEETTFRIFCEFLREKAFVDVGPYNHKSLSQLNPQARWLMGPKGQPFPCELVRYERLASDIPRLFHSLGLPEPAIPRENTSERGPFKTYYTQETAQIVREAYKADFEMFDYSDDPLDATHCATSR
jgi:hypothetical protein